MTLHRGERLTLVELRDGRLVELLADQDALWSIAGPSPATWPREWTVRSWGYGGARASGGDTALTLCPWEGRCLRTTVADAALVPGTAGLTRDGLAVAVFRRSDGAQVLWRAMLE